MTQVTPIEATCARLSESAQRRFLAASIEHVAMAFDRVAGLPANVRDEGLRPVLAALRSPVVDPARFEALVSTCQRLADELEATDLQSLLFACAEALDVGLGKNRGVRLVLNNLDEVVAIVDPEEETGCEEESILRAELLEAIGRDAGEATLEQLVVRSTEWERRFAEDYER
jgi:hypothetical protein